MNIYRAKSVAFISAASLILLTSSSALAALRPGTIANAPLQTAASAKPNVMFHVDSSGSMQIISPTPVGTYSYACSDSSALIPDGSTGIDLNIVANTLTIPTTYTAEITWNGTSRPLGNTSSGYCFSPTGTYTARLDDVTGAYGFVPYSGLFLNWYFDPAKDVASAGTWGSLKYKPGAKRRTDVAKASLKALLNTLVSVRVGLSSFNADAGVKIRKEIMDINVGTNRADLITAVDAIGASGSTPLAETLRDLGLYFSLGTSASNKGSCAGGTTDLVIHPGQSNSSPVACTTLFASSERTTTGSGIASNTVGPVEAFCQKNFVVMLTDGLPTSDSILNSNLKDYDDDCSTTAQTAGGYTCLGSDGSTVVSDPTVTTSPSFTDVKDNDPVLLATDNTDFLDDVAQALHEIDLRPDLNDEDGKSIVNNVITYTIGFADLQIKNSQLLNDTASHGGGINFFAEDATALSQAFRAAMTDIEGRSSTASAVTFNSSTLSSQSAVYQALFNTQRWSGELRSRPLDGYTGDILFNCTLGSTNCWDASSVLDGQSPSSRVILTMGIDHDSGLATGVPFRAPADYTTVGTTTTGVTVKNDLILDMCASGDLPYKPTAPADCTSFTAPFKTINNSFITAMINFLRGDRTHEAQGTTYNFRIRTHVLGDLVNSSPVYVGKPSMPWPDDGLFPALADPAAGCTGTITDNTAYSCWVKSSRKDRQPVVYVSSNDGMLHGFKVDDGSEVLAYFPSGTYSTTSTHGLHFLASTAYDHRFYNDLTPAVSDVYMNHKTSSGGHTGSGPFDASTRVWRTMLLGGQSAGGRHLYLLDVTDPTLFSESNARELVQWEFSNADDSNMGYSFSKPTIAMLNNGRFAAIFGNGYNSDTCTAGLYILYLEGGLDGSWTSGTDYEFIDTGYDPTVTPNGECNGMSTPALVDIDQNGTVDRVYAGDLHGNLWAFDMCNWDSTNSVCQTSGYGLANASPIMQARDNQTPAVGQPITTKPVVSRDPSSTRFDDLIVVFGTGQYLTSTDIDMTLTQQVQSMYGVRDYSAMTNGRSSWGLNPRNNADKFVQQTTYTKACDPGVCNPDGKLLRFITKPEKTIGSTNNGWFIDLIFNGERVVVNPKIRNDNVFMNTLIPETATCSAGGDGWLLAFNLKNGGIPLEPVFDITGDGVIDGLDKSDANTPIGEGLSSIPAESTFLGDLQYTPDSTGVINKRKVNVGKGQREGRLSWRELFQDD